MSNAHELFQQALVRLDYFNEELNRPEEDVVTFSICNQTHGIISDMLGAYLLLKGKDFSGAVDLEGLIKMSIECDEQFARLNLPFMQCYPCKIYGEESYCLDLDRVKSCIDIANEVKDIVSRHLGNV